MKYFNNSFNKEPDIIYNIYNLNNDTKRRNTIEISNFKIIPNNINSKNNNLSKLNSILSKSKEILVLSRDKKYWYIPLYKDCEIFSNKEPFNTNLIANENDEDLESVNNSIELSKNYLFKELNFGILSYHQKKYESTHLPLKIL